LASFLLILKIIIMFQVKQMLAFVLLFQLFGMIVFCDAQKDKNHLLARRLLEENSLGEVNDMNIVEAAEFVDTGNSTIVVGVEEGFEQSGIFFENVDGDENFEDGRRNLVSCGPRPTTPAFKVNDIRINGKCLSKNEPLVVPRYARITVDVTDEDVHCPGCIEQIHFGILDGGTKCVNAGGGNFGHKRISSTFVLEPGYHWVYLYGGWMYHCNDINKQVWHHWDTSVYGLILVQ